MDLTMELIQALKFLCQAVTQQEMFQEQNMLVALLVTTKIPTHMLHSQKALFQVAQIQVVLMVILKAQHITLATLTTPLQTLEVA